MKEAKKCFFSIILLNVGRKKRNPYTCTCLSWAASASWMKKKEFSCCMHNICKYLEGFTWRMWVRERSLQRTTTLSTLSSHLLIFEEEQRTSLLTFFSIYIQSRLEIIFYSFPFLLHISLKHIFIFNLVYFSILGSIENSAQNSEFHECGSKKKFEKCVEWC